MSAEKGDIKFECLNVIEGVCIVVFSNQLIRNGVAPKGTYRSQSGLLAK